MHLLCLEEGTIRLKTFYRNIPPYAILSHRWFDDEPTYHDFVSGDSEKKRGWQKILFCARQARKDDLRHFWVDTVCIDKSSSSELTEAINSMFRWYQQAALCYVFLPDVTSRADLIRSEWFTRGWTLQELLAPCVVEFYSAKGAMLGTRSDLSHEIHYATGISFEALCRRRPLSEFTVEERLSWVERRQTTREEDKAYCLLGIFDVHMPIIYGEGIKAFRRLNEEMRRLSQVDDTFVDKKRRVPNKGYNCNARLTWHRMAFGLTGERRGKCSKCRFNCILSRSPSALSVRFPDGRKLSAMTFLQRFHHNSDLAYNNDPMYRCFICRDGKALDLKSMETHLTGKHTWNQICGQSDDGCLSDYASDYASDRD